MFPRPEPADDVMVKVGALILGPNSPMSELMTNNSLKIAASLVYSLTSEINVPTDQVTITMYIYLQFNFGPLKVLLV